MTKEIQNLKEQLTSIKRTDEKIILLPIYTGYLIFITNRYMALGCIQIYEKNDKGKNEISVLSVKVIAEWPGNIQRFMDFVKICDENEVI